MKMKIVLGLISALFIGILIFAYVVTRRANPVMLDEHGRPINAAPAAAGAHD